MKIEILFPEISNIYGDSGNVMYLKQSIPNVEIIETNLGEKPAFIEEKIDLIYLGSMTEKMQEKAINSLVQYKENIKTSINQGQAFFCTGNAIEIFGQYIENEDGSKIDGLNILDIHSKRDMMHRYNSLFLGEFEGIKMVGFKSQFSHEYGDNSKNYFAKVIRGNGLNKNSKLEGVKVNNFIATTILGPILVLNPDFTKYFISNILKQENVNIAFEEEAMQAYRKRLAEFEDNKRKLV